MDHCGLRDISGASCSCVRFDVGNCVGQHMLQQRELVPGPILSKVNRKGFVSATAVLLGVSGGLDGRRLRCV